MDISMTEFKRVYEKLGVHFDYYTGESFYNDRTEAAIEMLKEKGLAKESEGALIVDLGEEMPPCMLRKADGATLYATRDIAAGIYRHEKFDFDLCLYVVGYPQELHFRQLFAVLKLAGFDWAENMYHVPFGHILGMSTRMGQLVLLDEVLNEAINRARDVIAEKNPDLENQEEIARAVGIGAVIFNDLKNSRVKDVNFDWNAILSFDGETGPYLQYTHVRFAGILRHLQGEPPSPADVDFGLLREPEEWQLVRDVESWPSILEQSANDFEPSLISAHLLRLASDFNRFYQKHRVVGDDAGLTAARVSLVLALRNVLAKGLSILGLRPLERM
jgi:arginyl-tRNA synthetase